MYSEWTKTDHISSIKEGWVISNGPDELPQIQRVDFPDDWRPEGWIINQEFTNDVEAWKFVRESKTTHALKALKIIQEYNIEEYNRIMGC